MVQQALERHRANLAWQSAQIKEQLSAQAIANSEQVKSDLELDQEVLRNTAALIQCEESARKAKAMKLRENFKKAWKEQMVYRDLHAKVDREFV